MSRIKGNIYKNKERLTFSNSVLFTFKCSLGKGTNAQFSQREKLLESV